MAGTEVRTSFEMKDGRILACVYGYEIIYGVHTLSNGDPGYPDEYDVGEATYFIDEEEIQYADLPKGLDVIADKLYNCGPGEFNYKETTFQGDISDDFDFID